jgi:3-deoxy-manno-octulosonate cytidylyltransferase (CMP-KDO synthetase)
LASSRLPQKALADIHGAPMIVHVWRRALEADVGRVVVAAGDAEIADAIHAAGGEAVLTDPDLPSGTDRIHQALERIDPDRSHDVIVNIQGDLPVLEAHTVRAALDALLRIPDADMGTVAAVISDPADLGEESVNKVVAAWETDGPSAGRFGRALYFSKFPVPWGEADVFHHIGIYTYRRTALDRFVSLPPSPLELSERLEQLRALEAGMRIEVARVETVPLGVDTAPQLEIARTMLKPQ